MKGKGVSKENAEKAQLKAKAREPGNALLLICLLSFLFTLSFRPSLLTSYLLSFFLTLFPALIISFLFLYLHFTPLIVPVIIIRQLSFFPLFFSTERSVRITKSVILRHHSCSETVQQKKGLFFTGRTYSYDRHNDIYYLSLISSLMLLIPLRCPPFLTSFTYIISHRLLHQVQEQRRQRPLRHHQED